MAYNEYTYRMKPVVIPGVLYLILNPACLIALDLYLRFDRLFLVALYGIYGVTAVAIFIIWAIAGSRKIVFDEHSIVLSDLFTKKVFNPNNIQRATFLWTSGRKKEVVKLRTRDETTFISDLYVPYQQLLTDMENYIYTYNIRTNLRTHSDRVPERYEEHGNRGRDDGHYRRIK